MNTTPCLIRHVFFGGNCVSLPFLMLWLEPVFLMYQIFVCCLKKIFWICVQNIIFSFYVVPKWVSEWVIKLVLKIFDLKVAVAFIFALDPPHVNSLAPGKFGWNFRNVISKKILGIHGWGISCEIALIWMSLNFTDDQSTLVQVIAWWRLAASHYLSQCWRHMASQISVAIWRH